AVIEAHHAHALGRAALHRYVLGADADQLAAIRDQDHVIVFADDADARYEAVARGRLDRDDALHAAVLHRVVAQLRTLAVAALAHRDQRGLAVARERAHPDTAVALAQRDAANAGGIA